MAHNGCPSCGGAELRVLPFVTRFSSVAYFRCPTCGDVWCINKEEGSHAERITKLKERQPPDEHAVLFTCPDCGDTLRFDGYYVEDDGPAENTVVLFSCGGHGFFRFASGKGLVAGLQETMITGMGQFEISSGFV